MPVRTLPRDPPGEGGTKTKIKNHFKHIQVIALAYSFFPCPMVSWGCSGYLKAVWPDFWGAFLKSGRPRGPGKAIKNAPPPKRPDCLQVPRLLRRCAPGLVGISFEAPVYVAFARDVDKRTARRNFGTKRAAKAEGGPSPKSRKLAGESQSIRTPPIGRERRPRTPEISLKGPRKAMDFEVWLRRQL